MTTPDTGGGAPPFDPNVLPNPAVDETATATGSAMLDGAGVEIPRPRAETTPGEATLQEIRGLLRDGTIKFGQINPVIAARHAADRQRLEGWARDWYQANQPDARGQDEAVRRFANTWLLYSIKSADAAARLHDQGAAVATLSAYNHDVVQARTMGFANSAEANALYSSPQELAACFGLKPQSRHLTDDAIRRCAENRPRDALGAVRDFITKAKALEERFGTRLDDPTIRHFASRQSNETCVSRAADYVSDVDLLTERYRGHELVTPSVIRKLAQDSTNPGLAIEERLAAADDLIQRYEGRHGLTKPMIFATVNEQSQPERRLEAYVRTVDSVREAYQDRLPDYEIRSLCLNSARPMAAARNLVGRVDRLQQVFGHDPNVTQSDMLYFAHNNRDDSESDLVDKVRTYSGNVTRAKQEFAGDGRLNGEIIRRASLQTDRDVVTVIQGKLATYDRLKAAYGGQGVPDWVIKDVIGGESDPEGAVQGFIRNTADLAERHGQTFARHIIQITQQRYVDANGQLNDRTAAMEAWRQKYGNLGAITDVTAQWAAVLSSNPEERLAAVTASGILGDIRGARRANPRNYPRGVRPDELQQFGVLSDNLAAWSRESAVANPPDGYVDMDTARTRFARMWQGYAREHGTELLTDDIARAAWEKYWNDVVGIQKAGFLRPEVLAEYNDATKLVNALLGSDSPRRDVHLADYRPADPIGRIAEYHQTIKRLEERFGGQSYVTPSMIHNFAQGRPSDPEGAMQQHLAQLRGIKRDFAGEPGVDDTLVYYLSNNYYANPANFVRGYLERYKTLQQIYSADSDFDPAVIQEIALNTTNNDTDHLRYLGERFKDRYAALRERLNSEGIDYVDEDLIRLAAANKSENLQHAVYHARRLQTRRRRQDIRLDEPLDANLSKPKPAEGLIGDPRNVDPLDLIVGGEVTSERLELLGRLLAGFSDAEKMLLMIKVGGASLDIDLDDLRRILGVDDLDAYAQELLARLRRMAGASQSDAGHDSASSETEDTGGEERNEQAGPSDEDQTTTINDPPVDGTDNPYPPISPEDYYRLRPYEIITSGGSFASVSEVGADVLQALDMAITLETQLRAGLESCSRAIEATQTALGQCNAAASMTLPPPEDPTYAAARARQIAAQKAATELTDQLRIAGLQRENYEEDIRFGVLNPIEAIQEYLARIGLSLQWKPEGYQGYSG